MDAMNLNLDELLAEPIGAKAPALVAEFVRDVEPEDLLALAEPRGSQPSPLKRVRTVHHQIARELATGAKPIEIAATTGYSLSRISILQNDPLFQELVNFYVEQENVRFAKLQDQIEGLGRAATEELIERLTSEESEFVSNKDLKAIAEMALDRSGHAPVKRQANLNVNLSNEALAALKEKVDGSRTDKIFDAALERGDGPGVGRVIEHRPAGAEAEEAEGVESSR